MRPITTILQDKTHIAPRKQATLGSIRSFLRKQNLVTAKQKKEINEENVIEMWGKYYGDLPSDSDSETISE